MQRHLLGEKGGASRDVPIPILVLLYSFCPDTLVHCRANQSAEHSRTETNRLEIRLKFRKYKYTGLTELPGNSPYICAEFNQY